MQSRNSLRLISSGGAARLVLEVKAGTAKKFGISAGDRVIDLPSTDSCRFGFAAVACRLRARPSARQTKV